MLLKRLLCVSIALTTGLFFAVYLFSQDYGLALLSVVSGSAWLYLEITNKPTVASLFFLIFLILAVWGNLQNLSAPIMLVGVSTALAAWDLSRFHARIRHEEDGLARTSLEKNHLQKLGMALCLGLGLGVIPLAISIPVNFVVLLGIILGALLILRQSVLSLRPKNRE